MRALVLVALAACSASPPPPGACPEFIGDRDAGVEMQIIAQRADSTPEVLTDGGAVALIQPPQGGKIIAAGMRAKNLCAGSVQIQGVLRDPPTNRVVGLEGRPVVYTAGADGWAEPAEPMQLSGYANVAVCPNTASSRDVQDQPYELTVSAMDVLGHTASSTISVTPFCAEPAVEARCRCECTAGYVLGQTCVADAGSL